MEILLIVMYLFSLVGQYNMSRYFNDYGIAIDAIKLKNDGLWLVPLKDKNNNKFLSISETKDGNEVAHLRVKTPLMKGGITIGNEINENEVATVKWVTWALGGGNLPNLNISDYDDNIVLTNQLKEKIDIMDNKISDMDSLLSTLNTVVSDAQLDRLEELFSNTIILWGGNAAGWEDDN